MTREKILSMPAGREMDKLVMERVTNFTVDDNFYIPAYSTDIVAAWQVIEKLAELGYRTHLSFANTENKKNVHMTLDHNNLMLDVPEWIEAETAPLAICRAALLTVK